MSTTAAAAALPNSTAAAALPAAPKVPWLGIAAVLLASVLVTLTSRLSTFALADIRGALGASVDEGAWITTAYSVAQMMVGPAAVWVGRALGPRRVLLSGAVVFCAAAALAPLAPNLTVFIALCFIAGLGSGTFVPMTIGYILQNVPRKYWAFGVGAYAMNVELSLNIAATIEGYIVENASWHWLFWQNSWLCLPLMFLISKGMPRTPIDRTEIRRGDFAGIFLACGGLSLIYAALDQGERLHWLSSPLIAGMAFGGLVLLAAFFAQQVLTKRQTLDLSLLARENLLVVFTLVLLLRVLMTAAGYLIPQYLGAVRGFRPAEIGDVLIWVAAPQFVLSPLVALVLMRLDARRVMLAGIGLIGLAFIMASKVTPGWAESDFIPSQLLQAVGQTASLTSLIYFSVLQFGPKDALTFGALIQTTRLMGGEIGLALVQVGTRVHEQQHSAWLWENISQRPAQLAERLAGYAAGLANSAQGAGTADGQALALLDRTVRVQAYTMACADMFVLSAAGCLVALALVMLLRAPKS